MTRKNASDELRDEVWKALVKAKGDRVKAAEILGKSVRTLNRYISELNLFPDMDKAGFIKHAGPPRGVERGESRRQTVITAHIKKRKGEIDYSDLAVELYGESTPKTVQRVYTAMNDLKGKGVVATDGLTWFVLG